jgi:hypothetical protein
MYFSIKSQFPSVLLCNKQLIINIMCFISNSNECVKYILYFRYVGWDKIRRHRLFEDTRVHVTPFFDQQQASFAVLIIYMLSICTLIGNLLFSARHFLLPFLFYTLFKKNKLNNTFSNTAIALHLHCWWSLSFSLSFSISFH